jgi:arsenical pump membrane protein
VKWRDSIFLFGYRSGNEILELSHNLTMLPHATLLAWSIIVPAIAGVIIRPFGWSEAIWAMAGAIALVVFGLLPLGDALAGMRKGVDVYLFLTGMMLIAELARREGLFDYLAAYAVDHARGSPQRLFLLVYAVGTLVTILLSNDATAIVLTPAVYAATRAAGASPRPYLFVCAFIANAASFVLPISNPANLVVFGTRMPHLTDWLRQFTLPSIAAIVLTYAALRLAQRRALNEETLQTAVEKPQLGREGRFAALGIVAIALVLLTASALDIQLGLPTFVCGVLTATAVLIASRQSPWPTIKGISWGVLPLVAGLFVMVEVLSRMGTIGQLNALLHASVTQFPAGTAWATGLVTAIADNIANNLPVGLVAGSVAASDHLPEQVVRAMLIGVDLGPNFSVTGSLATILWLTALRREKIEVSAWQFLKLGVIVTPPALVAALMLSAL